MTASNTEVLQDRVWLILGGAICAAAYGALAVRSQSYGDAQLFDMLCVCALCGLVTFALWLRFRRVQRPMAWSLVLGFAVLFRLIGVAAYPVLEDDFFRYLWDGWMFVEQGSPYGVAPADYFGSDAVPDHLAEVLDGVNYPQVATVYGPVAQWFFAASYLMAPGSVTALQILFGCADLLIVVLLSRLLPVSVCFLYAWSPLLVKEFAMSAHSDSLGVLFLIMALCCYGRRLWLLVGVTLALAAGVKVFALVAAPFLLGWQWRGWLGFVVTAVAVALPFGLIQAWVPEGLQTMGASWLFNAPLYLLALQGWGPAALPWTKIVLVGAFVLVWGWQYLRWCSVWRDRSVPLLQDLPLFWLTGLFLLVLPVLNPWYLIWWLPFAMLRPLVTPWVASVVLLLSYVSGINLSGSLNGDALELYQQPGWLVAVEFLLIGAAMVFDSRTVFWDSGVRR